VTNPVCLPQSITIILNLKPTSVFTLLIYCCLKYDKSQGPMLANWQQISGLIYISDGKRADYQPRICTRTGMDIMPSEAIPISQFHFLQSLTKTKWRLRKIVRWLKTRFHFIYGSKIMHSDTSLKNVLLPLQYLTATAACRNPTLLAFCLVVITNESRWRRMSNLEQTETANSPTHFVQNTVFPRPSELNGGEPDYPKSTPPRGNSVP